MRWFFKSAPEMERPIASEEEFPRRLEQLKPVAHENRPSGSDPFVPADDVYRQLFAFIAQLRDRVEALERKQ